jgi:hypothetical protein
LCTVGDYFFRNVLPSLPFFEAEVNMSARELVDMEPNIFFQAVLNEVFICKRVSFA